jgi:Domain of unknown function (DUF4157)
MFSPKQYAGKKVPSPALNHSARRSRASQKSVAEGPIGLHGGAKQLRFAEIPIFPSDGQLEAQANRASIRSGSANDNVKSPATVQRASLRQHPLAGSATSRAHLVKGSGRKLDDAERAIFEPLFGYDFGHVRLHTDASAAESARALHASAFTFGSDVVFANGAYAPHSSKGKQLLSHELAHVVQQGTLSVHGIQRQPAPGPDLDAGVAPSAGTDASSAATVLDPDANEAAARIAKPDLAQIDAKKKPEENEAAVKAVVLQAFGGEDALNKAFEDLAPIVVSTVDAYGKTDKTANRVQFFVRMRLYFNSWAEVLDHFSKSSFVRVNRGPVDVWLHKDAAARLNRVLDVMQKKNHPVPSIGEGFSLRDRHEGPIQSAGMMTHALGYAVDIQAAKNPKIGFVKPGSGSGPGQHDPYQISAAIDPSMMSMDMDSSTWKTIENMGKRTEKDKDPTLAAADDKDPEAQKYFQVFAEKFERMRSGSRGYLGTLSSDRKDKLLKLRQDYFDLLRKIAAEKKKGKKADPILLHTLEGQRPVLLAQIPALVTEWLKAIDAEIGRTLHAHAGMEKQRSPREISKDLKTSEANLRAADQAEHEALAQKNKAIGQRDTAAQVKTLAEQRERHARGGADFQKALAVTEKAREDLVRKIDAVVDSMEKEFQTRQELGAAQDERQKFATELKSSDPKLKGAWDWIDRLRDLRKALGTPDLSTPSGLKEFEGLTTGNLQTQAPVENPPLLRLLEVGFFNPDGAFDLVFFEEMAHSGFLPGATWKPGSADPMHFELLEGRNRTLQPGKAP